MDTAQITRRSIVGFGYTSACENDERGNLRVCLTTSPDHTGTIKQVREAIAHDRTLNSFRNGTYYTTAWFVKLAGKFHRIITDQNQLDYDFARLTEKRANMFDVKVFDADEITVEVE